MKILTEEMAKVIGCIEDISTIKGLSKVDIVTIVPYLVLGMLNIIPVFHLYESKNKIVKRIFKERWFTRPWHPFKKNKTIIEHVPMNTMYIHHNTVYMHPEIMKKLIRDGEKK